MAITTETNRTTELVTDGIETEFDFTMLIHADSEIQVWYKVTGGDYTQLTLDTHYTVTFTEDGGTVTTIGDDSPYAAGVILIIRHLALTQQTDWLFNDNHTGPQHEDDFDRSVMRDLQIQEQLDRAVGFATHSSTSGIEFPEPLANNIIGWNSDGDALENKAGITGIVLLTATDGNIIVGDGTEWVVESGAIARASLGLTIGTDVQAWDANLDSIDQGLYGINVETLTGDKTLTPDTDKMYQYLDEGGNNRIITLDTASATAGDRFVIRHNGINTDTHYLQVKQGAIELDKIYAGVIKEFIFDGTNWTAGETGTGEDDAKKYNLAFGQNANAYRRGAAFGHNSKSYIVGAAVGYAADGSTYGAAVGYGAHGMQKGVAIGYNAGNAMSHSANRGNIIIGYQAGDNITTGTYDILLGYDIDTPAVDTDNFMSLGNLIFGTGIDGTGTTVSSGNVGIAEPAPETLMEWTHAQPWGTWHCSTHSDDDDSGLVKWIAKREDGAGTETESFSLEVSHDGAGVNDQLTKVILKVNTGAGLVEGMWLDSNLLFTLAGGLKVTSNVGFFNTTPVAQEAHIIDADGQLADITTKFNTLLASLETYGLLAAT